MPDNLEPLTMDQLEVLEELSVPSRLAPSQVLSIRLTDTELRRLANEARLVGMKVGVFIKRSAIDAADTHRFSSGPAVQFGIAGDGLAYCGFQAQLNAASSAGSTVVSFSEGSEYAATSQFNAATA